jgi:hypothetical protein
VLPPICTTKRQFWHISNEFFKIWWRIAFLFCPNQSNFHLKTTQKHTKYLLFHWSYHMTKKRAQIWRTWSFILENKNLFLGNFCNIFRIQSFSGDCWIFFNTEKYRYWAKSIPKLSVLPNKNDRLESWIWLLVLAIHDNLVQVRFQDIWQ